MNLKDISWQVTEPEYREDKAISYSTIASFERSGFKGLSTLFDKKESPSLLFGSIVDTLLTDEENFSNLYVVSDMPQATESLEAIARHLAANYPHYNSVNEIPFDILANVGEEYNYYASEKYKNYRVKLIKEGCSKMFDVLKMTEGKTLISKELYADALACVNELKTNEDTSFYFAENSPFYDDVIRHYQLKFKGDWEGMPIRCMFDLIIEDKVNKRLIVCDLKTSSSPEYEFPKSYLKWSYYYQSSMYTHILKQNIAKHPEYEGWEITPYHFIVISNHTRTPMIWIDNSNSFIPDDCFRNGDKKVARTWTRVLRELHGYLSYETLPKYPEWKGKTNDIEERLREIYD